MRTKVILAVAAVLMLIIGVTAIGSNMGFKISIPLYASGGAHTGLNWVALPYYVSYTSASAAFNDITGCNELDQFQESGGAYRIYDGLFSTDDFPITSGGQLVDGNALLVKVGANTNWIVVGSHSPSFAVPLYASGGTHTGLNWRSVPYHTSKASASALFTDIANCNELDQFQESGGAYRIYDGLFSTDDFPTTAGLPVLVKVGANGTWTPSHY